MEREVRWCSDQLYWDYWGDRVHMTSAEVQANMDEVNALIRQTEVDILLAQEVDRNSKRAAYLDQVQYILDHTQMNYAAFVPVWKVRFLASEGYGRVESGIVVFPDIPSSRTPRLRCRIVATKMRSPGIFICIVR